MKPVLWVSIQLTSPSSPGEIEQVLGFFFFSSQIIVVHTTIVPQKNVYITNNTTFSKEDEHQITQKRKN